MSVHVLPDGAVLTPQAIQLKDYAPPPFLIDRIDLTVELGEEGTRVTSVLSVRRNGPSTAALTLNGKELELVAVSVNGAALAPDEYTKAADALTIPVTGDSFTVTTEVLIHPESNTELEGLYKSSGMFCTQCEAEGFRKITYYLDRPDVMARFTTRIIGDAAKYPVLLSNGNCIETGTLEGGQHFARWEDPFPKPSYLFALVAGDLACLEDSFTTRSGRDVTLKIFTHAPDIDKCDHAMASLKRSMIWDEQVYGREYDLDIFMIVAVGDFNMGAMENKGLNVFNTKYVLAKPETATDQDFRDIEAVIAHEYFHNWTGNRVTCRDWFQLSLKEGLTVFRDQQFSSDMGSAAVKRVSDVRLLRASQFPEDGGPMAHPIRPDSYIEINNFYTATVYIKGAEVVRMYHTLLGADGFRKGMDLYFERHDGQAVTCEDFTKAMEDANGADLTQFRRWYAQAGTPVLKVSGCYDEATKSFTLDVEQSCPPTPRQPEKLPFHIPLSLGLLGANGAALPMQLDGEAIPNHAETRTLDVTAPKQSFRFVNVAERPTPSLLRGFSSPVKLQSDLSETDLLFLMKHDTDPFARWEAGQQLGVKHIQELVADHQAGRPFAANPDFIEAIGETFADGRLDHAFIAQAVTLPGEAYLGEISAVADPTAIHEAREFLRGATAMALRPLLLTIYRKGIDTGPYQIDQASIAKRALKNAALYTLMGAPDEEVIGLAVSQYRTASNMTDALGALALLADSDAPERLGALAIFADKWQSDALVLDKWFAIQAMSSRADTLERVTDLLGHKAFDLKNPNKVRALIGSFATGNPYRFHDASGAGYRFLADQVLALDPINGKVAARMISPLIRWRKFDEKRQMLMRAELERVVGTAGLSNDVYEITSKGLSTS